MLRQIVQITDKLSIGPQPSENDLRKLGESDFDHIANLATEGEIDQKLTIEHAKELAENQGLKYTSMPISPTSMKIEHLNELKKLIADAGGPVYLHCGMGQRAVPFGLAYLGVLNKMSYNDLMQWASERNIEPQVPALQNFIKNCLHEEGLQIV